MPIMSKLRPIGHLGVSLIAVVSCETCANWNSYKGSNWSDSYNLDCTSQTDIGIGARISGLLEP